MPLSKEQWDEIDRRLEVANAIQREMNALADSVERKEAPGGWVIAEIHTPEYRKRWLQLSEEWRAAHVAVVEYLRLIVST
jgi:hypothetical protein